MRLFFGFKKEPNDLIEMLETSASKYSKKTALVFGAKSITYQQLINISKKLAFGLYNLGIREFDKVALWLPNCPEFVYSFFAILYLRATVVPINNLLKREEAFFILEDSRTKLLISSIDKEEDSQNILSRSENLKNVIVVSKSKNNNFALDFYDLVNKSQEFNLKIKIKDTDLAQIIYTSGTTGKPKGACLVHRNLIFNIRDCCRVIKFTHRDCIICVLPLFHSFASTVCMLLPLYRGAKIVIMKTMRPFKRVIRAIFKNHVTIFVGVPSIFNILAETKFSNWQLFLNFIFNPIRLCISGAIALPFDVWYNFEKKFRRPLLQGYGLTEASPVVSLNPLKGKRKPTSVGLPLPSVKVKVVDKENRELPRGEIGELLVKGPNVMQGYYNLKEETEKVLKDGWLYTGDLAKIDEDGFIYIVGRIKEMINVRGFNVYPKEIEDILYKHPKVKEVAVVGVSHPYKGEVPIAFVVKKEEVSEKEILSYLRTNLASYKVPLRIFFKENLPKSSTGKILKNKLQKELEGIFERVQAI